MEVNVINALKKRRSKGKNEEGSPMVEEAPLKVKDVDPDRPLSIQIWDTSGAERYRAITTNHIRGADGAYLVYGNSI